MSDADDEVLEATLRDDDAIERAARRRREGEPDVLLNVQELRVDEISLDVENLRARVALEADVLELLNLHVGVEAELGRVQLTIKGVEAQVLLKVHLDNVARILDRVMKTIDNNPEIVKQVVEQAGVVEPVVTAADEAVGAVGVVADAASEDVVQEPGSVVGDVGRGAATAGKAPETAAEDLRSEAPTQRPADPYTERPRRPTQRETEARPRRKKAPEPTKGRARKTSRRWRNRGPKER